MPKIWLNDRLVASGEALVSVEDRGFRFGDGIFETIRVLGGTPYLWRYHRERLEAGLTALRLTCDTRGLLAAALQLLKENAVEEGMLRIAVSRGIGSRGYMPSNESAATIVMETLPLPPAPQHPFTLWLSRYEKISPLALPTHCKTAQGLNSTLARMEAADNGCDEALQLGAGGAIAEASSATIFWLKKNVLYTPSLATGALMGVTRRRLCELSPYPVVEGEYSISDLLEAESAVLANAAFGAAAIGRLHPQGAEWKSEGLAALLNGLLDADRASDTRALRESLA